MTPAFDAKKYADHLVAKKINPVIENGIPAVYQNAEEWEFEFLAGDFPHGAWYEEVCNALLENHADALEAYKKKTGSDLKAEIIRARDWDWKELL